MVAVQCALDCAPLKSLYSPTMQKLPGVLLFIVLALVILQILSLRALSQAEKRLMALEKKVETLSIAPTPSAAAAQPVEAK